MTSAGVYNLNGMRFFLESKSASTAASGTVVEGNTPTSSKTFFFPVQRLLFLTDTPCCKP